MIRITTPKKIGMVLVDNTIAEVHDFLNKSVKFSGDNDRDISLDLSRAIRLISINDLISTSHFLMKELLDEIDIDMKGKPMHNFVKMKVENIFKGMIDATVESLGDESLDLFCGLPNELLEIIDEVSDIGYKEAMKGR